MPLVNCIPCLLKHALLSTLCYLFLKFVVYVPKMPRWVEPMPYLTYVSPKDFTGHTHLVFHQVKLSTLMPLSKREVNVRLCFREMGVDPELCVHAHGPDVEFIMEASCINNGPLVISSSCIYVGPLRPWFRP